MVFGGFRLDAYNQQNVVAVFLTNTIFLPYKPIPWFDKVILDNSTCADDVILLSAKYTIPASGDTSYFVGVYHSLIW